MFDFLIRMHSEERSKYQINPHNYEMEIHALFEILHQHPSLSLDDEICCYMAMTIKIIAMRSSISPTNKVNFYLQEINDPNSQPSSHDPHDRFGLKRKAIERMEEKIPHLWTSAMLLGSLLVDKKFNSQSINLFYYKDSRTSINLSGDFLKFKQSSYYLDKFIRYLTEDKVNGFLMRTSLESIAMKAAQEKLIAEKKAAQLEIESFQKVQEEQRQEEEAEDRRLSANILYHSKHLLSEVTQPDVTVRKIKMILDNKADVNYQNEEGYSALMIALDVQNDRIAEYLLKQGANPALISKHGETASTIAFSRSAIYEIIQEVLKISQLKNLSATERLNKIFHDEIMSFSPQTRKIQKLLHDGVNINCQSVGGYSALMLAVDSQNDRIAEYLLKQGADPLLKNDYDEIASDLAFQGSPIFIILKNYELLYAAFHADLAMIVRLINQGADINFQGLGGYTILLIAVEQSNVGLVELIMSHNPDLSLTRKDGQGVLELVTDEAILEILESDQNTNEVEEEVMQSVSESSKKTAHSFF